MNVPAVQTSGTVVRPMAPNEIALVKNTIAKDCNDDEFNLFMAAARNYGLDPLRRQIMPLVFGKNARDQSKRRMSIVIGIDGYRVIASRCGNYRPSEDPPVFTYDHDIKDPKTNPLGIVSVTVKLWTEDKQGRWFPVSGEAYWDEFAPLEEIWMDDPDGGTWDNGDPKKVPSGQKRLDPKSQWMKMPRVMLAKCATNQALRAGWPEQYAGLYGEEEMEKAVVIDHDASKIAEFHEEERRLQAVQAIGTLPIIWEPNAPIEYVPEGKFFDRVCAFLQEADGPGAIQVFTEQNRHPMREFWARHKGDALELRKAIDARIEELRKAAADALEDDGDEDDTDQEGSEE